MIEAASPRREGTRILVVDDCDDARINLREALEDVGYDVVEAAHGQQALHYLVSHPAGAVDLILLDLVMPVMDGWDLLRVLSNYAGLRGIPVLIVSGHPERLAETKHHRVVGVLRAPYEMPELLTLVDISLSH